MSAERNTLQWHYELQRDGLAVCLKEKDALTEHVHRMEQDANASKYRERQLLATLASTKLVLAETAQDLASTKKMLKDTQTLAGTTKTMLNDTLQELETTKRTLMETTEELRVAKVELQVYWGRTSDGFFV